MFRLVGLYCHRDLIFVAGSKKVFCGMLWGRALDLLVVFSLRSQVEFLFLESVPGVEEWVWEFLIKE